MTNLAVAFCLSCGGDWFEIVDREDPSPSGAAVQIDGGGKIIAWSGTLRCYDCEEEITFPMRSPIPERLDDAALEALEPLPPLVTGEGDVPPRPESSGASPRGRRLGSAAPD